MSKIPKHIPRGSFGKGTEIYKESVAALKDGMRQSGLATARKIITEKINKEIAEVHSVKITDDQLIFLNDKHEIIKTMKA